MLRLVESINRIPEASLILWKKFVFIKRSLKHVINHEMDDVRPVYFGAFLCILGLLGISTKRILSLDPIKLISDQVKTIYNDITSICKEATADDLISITIHLLPEIKNDDDLRARLNILYEISQLQSGHDSMTGCFVTLMASVQEKSHPHGSHGLEEYNKRIETMATKIKLTGSVESKEHFSRLFSVADDDAPIKDCVDAYEQVFENISASNEERMIFDFYREQCEVFMFDFLKNDTEILKNYLTKEDLPAVYDLFLKDYKDPKSIITKYLSTHESLNFSFECYAQAMELVKEKKSDCKPEYNLLTKVIAI